MTTDTPALHVFHVDEANEYWVAVDAADVQGQRLAMFGEDVVQDDDYVHQLSDDYVLTIGNEDEPDAPGEAHTCADWAKQEGLGLLCACEP